MNEAPGHFYCSMDTAYAMHLQIEKYIDTYGVKT